RELGHQAEIGEKLDLLRTRLENRELPAERDGPERMGESIEYVGRTGELADLRGAWMRARTGYSGIACLLGPTGIGKSRLAAELLAGIEQDGGRVAQAKGYRGEHRIPWGTVADLVQQLMRLPGAKGISSGSEAVLGTVLPSLSRNGVDADAANGMGGIHPAALSDAVADLVEAVGFELPLIVFLDDWQWVDKESRALLGKVMRRVRGLACLFLLAERTGERRLRQEGAEALIRDLGGRRIVLGPLSEDELGELLGLWAEFEDPEDTAELVGRIHRVTGGNPLFIGEVLRKLVEDGIYRQEEGRWMLRAGRLGDDLDLPESVQGLIRERLERLNPTAAQVAAALAGERRSVHARILRRRAGLDEAVFARAMGELVDREVVTWVGTAEVDFAHDQLREAAGLFFESAGGHRFLSRVMENPTRSLMGAAALVAVTLLLIAGASRVWPGLFGAEQIAPPTYPFGKGRIVLVGDSLMEVIPPAREGEAWTVSPSSTWHPSPPLPPSNEVFRAPWGEIRWFGEEKTAEDPPRAVEYHPDGSRSVLFNGAGDEGFFDLSPSGDIGLLMVEGVAAPRYRQDLTKVSVEDGTAAVLYRPAEMLHGADWSPDGQRIAVVVAGA
ncbi:MAG: AAA family ATPase, partial [Longimicrobiales bacterium]|nr:AAA family ATPase [Longimicrobiales bacterium]